MKDKIKQHLLFYTYFIDSNSQWLSFCGAAHQLVHYYLDRFAGKKYTRMLIWWLINWILRSMARVCLHGKACKSNVSRTTRMYVYFPCDKDVLSRKKPTQTERTSECQRRKFGWKTSSNHSRTHAVSFVLQPNPTRPKVISREETHENAQAVLRVSSLKSNIDNQLILLSSWIWTCSYVLKIEAINICC